MKRPRLLAMAALVAVGFIAFLLFRAVRLVPEPHPPVVRDGLVVDTLGAARRLADVVRHPAVSRADAPPDTMAFLRLHGALTRLYPDAFGVMGCETVASMSLLCTWRGTDAAASPLLLLGHLDTVPADSEAAWQHGPFSGDMVDGVVWGRGVIDDRSNVAGILEAVGLLARAGVRPAATVYVAFGHDEEQGGMHGAAAIARQLSERGVRAGLVLDEGGFVTHGTVPGVQAPVAVVGVAEKGGATFRLTARAEGGHSSIPPAESAIGRLAAALVRLEDRPMPARLEGPTWELLRQAAPHMNLGMRMVFANRWLFEPVILRRLAAAPTTNATIRTTQALTVVRGGSKSNVLPDEAEALVNYRLLPGDGEAAVRDHIRRAVDDPRMEVQAVGPVREASRVSPSDGTAFELVAATIRASFPYPEIVVAPYLVVGGTDARHYEGLAEAVYRFQPVELFPERGSLLHATNERLPVREFAHAVGFYARLIALYQEAGVTL